MPDNLNFNMGQSNQATERETAYSTKHGSRSTAVNILGSDEASLHLKLVELGQGDKVKEL